MKIMLTLEERRILAEANDRFGLDNAVKMVMEECAETIVELNHWDRGRSDIGPAIEELGDSIVCMAQVLEHEQRINGRPDPFGELEAACTRGFQKLKDKLEREDFNYSKARESTA